MKQLILLVIVITLTASCSSKKDSPVTEEKNTNHDFILDSLLRYNSEAELIAAFGKENVGRDTAWHDEGGPYMVTTLYPKSNNEVKFTWTDSASYAGLHLITLQKDSSAWSSHGVKMGTTLKELIQLNGKDFTFPGLNWNNPGGQLSWGEGGNLSGLHLTLNIANYDLPKNVQDSLIEAETVSSKSEIARKYNPFVDKIILRKD